MQSPAEITVENDIEEHSAKRRKIAIEGDVKKSEDVEESKEMIIEVIEEHPIFHAASIGDIATIKQYLEQEKGDINRRRDADGATMLVIAAKSQQASVVTLLLKHKADLNLTPTSGDDQGLTALWQLCSCARYDIALQLLENANSRCDLTLDLEGVPAPSPGEYPTVPTLWWACHHGHKDKVKDKVPAIKNQDKMPDIEDIILGLLAYAKTRNLSLNLNAVPAPAPTGFGLEGLSAVWWACYHNLKDAVLALIEHANQHNLPLILDALPTKEPNDNTALCLLSKRQQYEAMAALLEHAHKYNVPLAKDEETSKSILLNAIKKAIAILPPEPGTHVSKFDDTQAYRAKNIMDFLLVAQKSELVASEKNLQIVDAIIARLPLFAGQGHFTYFNRYQKYFFPNPILLSYNNAILNNNFHIAASILFNKGHWIPNPHLPPEFLEYLSHQLAEQPSEVTAILEGTKLDTSSSTIIAAYADLPTINPTNKAGQFLAERYSVPVKLHANRQLAAKDRELAAKDRELAQLRAELAALKSAAGLEAADPLMNPAKSRVTTIFATAHASPQADPVNHANATMNDASAFTIDS